jgi:hypothetical protein
MLRLMQLRFAAIALVAAALVSLGGVSAWAFSQENLNLGDASGNSRFADPSNQVKQGSQPFGPGGPTLQFGARQGGFGSMNHFQGSNATPPDPYSRPLGNGN